MTEEIDAAVPEMDRGTVIAHLRAQQNFPLAVAAGLGSAVIGAALWAGFVYVTQYQLGLIAVAVGALVGYSVRVAGRGVDTKFGVLGAVCGALGWLLGTIAVDLAMVSQVNDMPFSEVLAQTDLDKLIALMSATSDVMDLLFLGICVYEGYRFAFMYKIN
jgi:hypothetical protein